MAVTLRWRSDYGACWPRGRRRSTQRPSKWVHDKEPENWTIEGVGGDEVWTVENFYVADLQAVDGEIGHVEDLMVDLESWTIRDMVIDTSNWIGGRTVLVSPEWVRRIDWTDQKIHVDMTREHVENSPPCDPGMEVDRTYEEQVCRYYERYYERPAYWKR